MNECVGGYSPPLCVWKVIEESASPEKLSVFRSLIGESKVDYASDLRSELDILLEIWSELYSGTLPAVSITKRKVGLPEPPQQREMLVGEIHLLLESLKDKETVGLGFIPTDCDENIINYASHIAELRTPSPATTVPVLRTASRNSSNSMMNNEEIEAVTKNMPILDNEAPIHVLRSTIEAECDILLEDIEYVRKCVEEGRCDYEEVAEPSLTELRQERKKLEGHLMKSIEISPAISRERSKITSLPSTPTKSNRISSSIKKNRSLPPVRPLSATRFSSNPETQNTPKGSPAKIPHKRSETPTLGARSRTYPTETEQQTKKKVTRRKSTSALPFRSKESSSAFHKADDSTPGRKHVRVFCGSPDSGVSSRPASELAMVDGGTLEFEGALKPHVCDMQTQFSDMQLSRGSYRPSAVKADHFAISDSNRCRSVTSAGDTSPKPGIVRRCGDNSSTPLMPQPPTRGKARPAMHSAKFRKVKVTGMHGS